MTFQKQSSVSLIADNSLKTSKEIANKPKEEEIKEISMSPKIKMANKQIKRCTISLVVKQIQVEMPPFKAILSVKSKRRLTLRAGASVRNRPSHSTGEGINLTPLQSRLAPSCTPYYELTSGLTNSTSRNL